MPVALLALIALLAYAAPAAAQVPGLAPLEIPGSPIPSGVDEFTGAPAQADPHRRKPVPQHPFMARNPGSNIHNDAYQTDSYRGPGPLGHELSVTSALFAGGVAFGYFVVMKPALSFLLNFNDQQFNIQVRAREYYTFVVLTLMAMGLVFQVPLLDERQ